MLQTIQSPTLQKLLIACLPSYLAISESQNTWDRFYIENLPFSLL